jgi:cystathionine beta-lyase
VSTRWRPATRLIRAARKAEGAVNPAVSRGSTIVKPTVNDLYTETDKTYGLDGHEIHDALAAALCDLGGAAGCVLAPSGLAAVTMALLSYAEAGCEFLVTDSAYGPTRRFCDGALATLGVRTIYYDPRIGGGLARLITEKTRLVVLESPGSLTFEVQDVPAIAAAAHAAGVATLIDDTWSAGIFFNPFAHGIDVSIQALTKYQAGHADVLLGAALGRTGEIVSRLRKTNKALGIGVGGSDEAYLALRGLRTMIPRLERHEAGGYALARWLEGRPEVAQVLHPGLDQHPDHALWARDFTGAAGLFGFVLHDEAAADLDAMLEGFEIFAMGFSWGGYESLIIPCDPQVKRSATSPRLAGPLLRISVGLEDPQDLIADLEAGFDRLAG